MKISFDHIPKTPSWFLISINGYCLALLKAKIPEWTKEEHLDVALQHMMAIHMPKFRGKK